MKPANPFTQTGFEQTHYQQPNPDNTSQPDDALSELNWAKSVAWMDTISTAQSESQPPAQVQQEPQAIPPQDPILPPQPQMLPGTAPQNPALPSQPQEWYVVTWDGFCVLLNRAWDSVCGWWNALVECFTGPKQS